MGAEAARPTLDLLGLLPGTYRKAGMTNGGEHCGPCPQCGGADRFRVWPDADKPHAWCRQCGWRPDAIAVLRELHGYTYADAAAAVGKPTDRTFTPARQVADCKPPIDDRPPPAAWQGRGRELVTRWQTVLWSDAGARALRYLREQRHLTDATIRAAGLGYNASDYWDPASAWGTDGKRLFFPRGIVIPSEAAGHLWYVKVRKPTGKPKYIQPRGSRPALFGTDQLAGRAVLVFAEGEFDALLLRQSAGDLVDVVTLGSASTPLGGRWLTALLPARRILAAYDFDAAGQRANATLAGFSARVVVARPVGGGDLTDQVRAGGDLRAWVTYRLAPPEAPMDAPLAVVPPTDAPPVPPAPPPVLPMPARAVPAAEPSAQRCYNCQSDRWWTRWDGVAVCQVCHPPPAVR
jgi:hypothetical protein